MNPSPWPLDGRQPNDGPRTMGVGLEIWTLQSFVLRGGYTTEGDLGNGLRIGAGIRFKTIQSITPLPPKGPWETRSASVSPCGLPRLSQIRFFWLSIPLKKACTNSRRAAITNR